MKRLFYFPLILLILLMGYCAAWAQDPVFSQFYAAPLHTNPAFAGTTFAPRFTFNYRNQWPGFNNAYVTYAASYEQPMEDLNSGLGFTVMVDNAGDGIYKVNRFNAIYGYRLQVNKKLFLKFGVQGGLIQNTVDWNKLIFADQIDQIDGLNNFGLSQEAPSGNLKQIQFWMSVQEFLMYGEKFYGGLSR